MDEELIEEWFEMVQENSRLVRRESTLVYELRDLELIEQHDQLEREIRKRLSKEGQLPEVRVGGAGIDVCVCVLDSKKTEMDRIKDEAMIAELVELVEKRNKLLWDLDEEKQL